MRLAFLLFCDTEVVITYIMFIFTMMTITIASNSEANITDIS